MNERQCWCCVCGKVHELRECLTEEEKDRRFVKTTDAWYEPGSWIPRSDRPVPPPPAPSSAQEQPNPQPARNGPSNGGTTRGDGRAVQAAMTLDEIGREFGVGKERIRTMESVALRKLRHPSKTRKLREYMVWLNEPDDGDLFNLRHRGQIKRCPRLDELDSGMAWNTRRSMCKPRG